jgi:hypothetical protein
MMKRYTVQHLVDEADGLIRCNHPWRYGDVTQGVYDRIWDHLRKGQVVCVGCVSQTRVMQLKKDGLLISNTNGRCNGAWPVKVIWVCGEA